MMMKQRILLLCFLLLWKFTLFAQVNKFPVKEWAAASQTPLILYVSGDGGNDNFSIKLCAIINSSGYAITALDARSYFWKQKTAAQAATDFTNYLENKFQNKKEQPFILVGYSFGADILPFVINQLTDSLKEKLVSVILLSPSISTGLHIHKDNKIRSMDVLAEINKMNLIKTTIIFGSTENTFPLKEISLKNYSNEILPGGHHYEGNVSAVAKVVMKHF